MTTISLEMAERLLIKFDGNKTKLFEFLDNCDKAMRLVNPDHRDILFSIIETKITDKARAIVRNREFPDWESLKSHLLDAFSEKRTLGQWQLELHSCKQLYKENVMSFANRVESCYIKVINSLDHSLEKNSRSACVNLIKNEALNIFLNGLNKDLTILVKSQRPDTLENAIAIALNEEQQLKSKIEINQFHNRHSTNQSDQRIFHTKGQFCNYCKKTNHTIDNCYKLKNKTQYQASRQHNYANDSGDKPRTNNKTIPNYYNKNKPHQTSSRPHTLNSQGPLQPAMRR